MLDDLSNNPYSTEVTSSCGRMRVCQGMLTELVNELARYLEIQPEAIPVDLVLDGLAGMLTTKNYQGEEVQRGSGRTKWDVFHFNFVIPGFPGRFVKVKIKGEETRTGEQVFSVAGYDILSERAPRERVQGIGKYPEKLR
jgi:hypothetical protein